MQIAREPKAVIMARVFRARKEKPRLIPRRFWAFAQKRRWPGTGRWENHGVIASTNKGNAQITQQ